MKLLDQIPASGDGLFRWRSYLPLLLLPLFIASLFEHRVHPSRSRLAWEIGCFALSLAGLAIRAFTVGTAPAGTSERATGAPRAAVLNTAGAYSVVRHPLYLANAIMVLGVSLFSPTWYLPLIVILVSLLYYERIAAREEAFLETTFGESFHEWAARVPAMIPSFSGYRRPERPFSVVMAVQREFHGLFALVSSFFVLDLVQGSTAAGALRVERFWLLTFVATAGFYLIMVARKRRSVHRPTPLVAAMALAVAGATLHAQPPAAEPLSLDEAFARALAANPSIAAVRLRRAIDLAGTEVARERPNPEARLEQQRDAPHEGLSLALPLETGGKRSRRIALNQATARTTEAEINRSIADVHNLVRRAYYELTAAERRVAVLDDLRALAGRARDAARQRFDAGGAPRLEVLQAQLALAQADNEITSARGAVLAARASLNALMGSAPGDAIRVAADFESIAVPLTAALTNQALASNAELALLDRRIEEASARATLARALQSPDPVVEGGVTHGARPEFDYGWRGGLSVSIPVFTRHRGAVVVEEATIAQLEAEREASAARIRAAVFGASATATAQRQQYLTYRDEILPQVVEVERMAEDSYRLGQTGLVALLQSLQATRDVRLRALAAGLDYQLAIADLERAVGAPLR